MSEIKCDIKKIKAIPAIDMHCHLNFGHPGDSNVYTTGNKEYVRRTFGESAPLVITNKLKVYDAFQEYLDISAKEANIEYTFTSSFAAVLHASDVIDGNEYLLDLVKKRDNLFQWAVVDPREEYSFKQARDILESGKGVGLKVVPGYHNYEINDYGDKIFKFAAEYETNILRHPVPDRPIVTFADKYPELNFITAHMCTSHISCCKHKNIYTDTSSGSSLGNNIIEAASTWIPDHVMFGTDTNHAGAFRGRIEYALMSDEIKYKMLRGTAEKLFAKYLNK